MPFIFLQKNLKNLLINNENICFHFSEKSLINNKMENFSFIKKFFRTIPGFGKSKLESLIQIYLEIILKIFLLIFTDYIQIITSIGEQFKLLNYLDNNYLACFGYQMCQ